MRRTVFRNIVYGLKARGDLDIDRDKVFEALEMVGLPGEVFARRQWYELSGGEAQRVALAARLILQPEVLILDEPTASVDAASVQRIKEASLMARKEWGTTLVIASHDHEWLQEVCDETLFMFRGRLLGSGRDNIIFGPWQPTGNGRYARVLHDGQRFFATGPPNGSDDAVALFGSDDFHLQSSKTKSPPNQSWLQGTIARLAFEKRDGRIVATVVIDGLTLTVRLQTDASPSSDLYPGRKIFLHYDPDAVHWVN
jgi:tungstate transport system ATP-binding protein